MKQVLQEFSGGIGGGKRKRREKEREGGREGGGVRERSATAALPLSESTPPHRSAPLRSALSPFAPFLKTESQDAV